MGIGNNINGIQNNGDGIQNAGIINTGKGNDSITATGGSLNNDGTIDTGDGNDIVDALTGGFSSTGTTLLGNGNDILKGFGTGNFDGGNDKDTLLFGTGSYTVSDNVNLDGFYTISKGSINMFVKDFEFIGSASNPDAVLCFSNVIGETFTV